MREWGEGPESADEIEMSRRQDERLEWRRKMLWCSCPICFDCGFVITTVSEARMVVNWCGQPDESRLFHEPCMKNALELMSIRACAPRRPDKYEIAALLSSFPVSSAPMLRGIAEGERIAARTDAAVSFLPNAAEIRTLARSITL